VRPEELGDAHADLEDAMRHPARTSPALLDAAKQAASLVRANASRAGHSVQIRVASKHDGVRITVVGPQATKYQHLVNKTMDELMPGVHAQIRAQVTRGRR
jgi:hypothetical protein